MSEKTPKELLQLLRRPFEPHHISKLPKPTKQQTEEIKADYKKGIRCEDCGGWHHPKVVHLDYVGHAALTDRLLECDIHWYWEPLALDEFGLPRFDKSGGLWIKLTVCGMSRIGYGNAETSGNKDNGSREKEIIGDALRNAAMRFGAALDLWHKGDLHKDKSEDQDSAPLDISDKPFDLSNEETIDQELEKVAKSIPNRATEYLANNEALNRTIRYGYSIKECKNYLSGIDEMETELAKRKKAALATLDFLTNNFKLAMEVFDTTLVAGQYCELVLQNAKESVIIENEALIPDEFKEIVTQTKVLKDAIYCHIKNGGTVAGATLQANTFLKVKYGPQRTLKDVSSS